MKTMTCERVRRAIDQSPCDHCGRMIGIDTDATFIHAAGLIYCDHHCAQAHQEDNADGSN